MTAVSLADAKARLSELIQRTEAGETIEITRRGRPVARLSAIEQPRQPIDFEALRRLRDSMPYQEQSAGEFIRWMRDTDRY